MRNLPCALLLLTLLLIPAASSEAAPIVFDFTVGFTSGPLIGQSFLGSFSVEGDDCPGGICSGLFDIDGPQNVLSFDITIDGVAFDIGDTCCFITSPLIVFSAGNVTTLNFTTSSGTPSLEILSPFVRFRSAADQQSGGRITNIEQQVPIPEPASLSLLGVGLAGLGVRRWRQRKVA